MRISVLLDSKPVMKIEPELIEIKSDISVFKVEKGKMKRDF